MKGPGHTGHEAILDIADEVCVRVTRHPRVAPALGLPTTDDDTESEEEVTTPAPRRKGLKSDKICTADTADTADTAVLRKITWPHEVAYTRAGQSAVYEEISISLLVSGYLLVMAGEKDEIKPYMI